MVTPIPYDPGGTFIWSREGEDQHSGAPMLQSAPPSGCGYSANGGSVAFDCGSGTCTCHGCSLDGTFHLEQMELTLPTIWCGCWYEDPDEDPEPTPEPHSDMASRPSVTATFSKSVVLFEDAYTNAPGEVVQRQSSETILTISAYGGANGAYLQVYPGILDAKLIRTGGHNLPRRKVKIPENSDVVYEIAYQGKVASGAAKDIKVRATLTAINEISPLPSTAEATSAQLQMEAVSTFPTNRARHVFGPLEESRIKVFPEALMSRIEITGEIPHEGKVESTKLTSSTKAATFNLDVKCEDAELTLAMSVIEPEGGVQGIQAEPFTDADWDEIEETPLMSSEAGVTGNIWVRVLPQHVSFQHIRMLEGTAPAVAIWGCCTNQTLFPPESIAHGVMAGGSSSYSSASAKNA